MSFCLKPDKSEDDFDFDESDFNAELRTNSSSSSIKWSLDARKQNQNDWLQIERILYEEEDLPQDEKTKEEFKTWMGSFPHLRIVGKKIEIPPKHQLDQQVIAEKLNFRDEIYAIDPGDEPFRLLDRELSEKLTLRRTRRSAEVGICGGNRHIENNEKLENLLRITSGVRLQRTNQRNFSDPMMNKKVDRTSTILLKPIGKKLSRITEHKTDFKVEPRVHFLYEKPTNIHDNVRSASKLPIHITTLQFPKHMLASKSASIHRKLNPIVLSSFNYGLDFPNVEHNHHISKN